MEGYDYDDYRRVFNSSKMYLMQSSYEVPLSLKYEKMEKEERCDVFPCKKKTRYRLVEYAVSGGGCSGAKMYMCYNCYQKHKELVFEARKLKKKSVVYYFQNWTEVK